MDVFYWSVGYIVICLLWIVPAAMFIAALLNGLMVTISMTGFEIVARHRNKIPLPPIKTVLKVFFSRILSECDRSSGSVQFSYGVWTYPFGFVFWKVEPKVEEAQ